MKKALSIILFTVIVLSCQLLFAQDKQSSNIGSLLPDLERIAHDDGDKIFTICEIHNGKSNTVIIRPNNQRHNSYSITKLFTVATIGVMETQGLLDVDDPVYPILKEYFPNDFDPQWQAVKISDVIRHRTGFGKPGYLDIDAEDSSQWPRDYLAILLSTKLEHAPGKEYVYTDATFYLASRIVEAIAGEKLNEFMIRELLDPMRFKEYAFATDPQGSPIGATGLYISTDDMAKLGQLLVQDGIFEGKRLISKSFIDEAFERTFELYPVGNAGVAFVKGGYLGQLLYMNRKTKRVVAIHSYNGDCDAILQYLLEHDQ